MNRLEILVTGSHRKSLNSMTKLSDNNNDWVFTTAANDEEAIEKFHQREFDIVLFTGGMTDDEERKLRKIFMLQNPDIIILKHDGIDSSMLTAKITAALDKQRQERKPSFSFVDDALKNAGLHITIE